MEWLFLRGFGWGGLRGGGGEEMATAGGLFEAEVGMEEEQGVDVAGAFA
jgi:hypothetical protein